MIRKFENWLARIVGKELEAVSASIFSFDGDKNYEHPQLLDLQFRACGHGILGCGPDGSSIHWQNDLLVDIDLGENGEERVEDVSKSEIWQDAIHSVLRKVEIVCSDVDKSDIGIRFSFEGAVCKSIFNLGDDLYVFNKIPIEILEEERLSFRAPGNRPST